MSNVAATGELTVDVVIATRNRRRFLEQCLASIRGQTLQPRRVIVVDDGSTDDTRAALEGLAGDWPNLTAISVSQRGVSAARNIGISRSTSDLVAFNDDDDLWLPTMLERQVALFRGRPRTGFVYCGFCELDAAGNDLVDGCQVRPERRGEIFHDILERFHGIALPTIVARRSLLIDVGGFDESMSQAEDRDLCLALARRAEVDCNSETLVGVRKHPRGAYGGAMRHDPELVLNQRLSVWNKWREDFVDRNAVLARFRVEAAAVAIALLTRLPPDLGLYRRLSTSNLLLARELFPTRRAFLAAVLAALGIGRQSADARLGPLETLKWALARRVILPSPTLLGLARRLGKFRDGSTHVSGDGE
ncbi:MAG: glycosyltransferase family 2 protein [Devosia sp.]|nr:glycosyltransferase family 2 protein [Devosia sp.]